MNVFFRFHYFFLSPDPYPLVLRIYKMTTKPPKRQPPKQPVLPQELALEFKKRAAPTLKEEPPTEMVRLLAKLAAVRS